MNNSNPNPSPITARTFHNGFMLCIVAAAPVNTGGALLLVMLGVFEIAVVVAGAATLLETGGGDGIPGGATLLTAGGGGDTEVCREVGVPGCGCGEEDRDSWTAASELDGNG